MDLSCSGMPGCEAREVEVSLHVVTLRMLGKSDGGSAFEQFEPTSPKARSSGDPLIELLAYLLELDFRCHPAATLDDTTDSALTPTPSR